MTDDELETNLRVERPRTRDDCRGGERPCPWVSCAHHLALNISEKTGLVTLTFPDREIWDIPETCSLDVADRGDHTLDEIAKITNVTRERIRQIESKTLRSLHVYRRRMT